jgi:hypothetical protein
LQTKKKTYQERKIKIRLSFILRAVNNISFWINELTDAGMAGTGNAIYFLPGGKEAMRKREQGAGRKKRKR